MAKKQLTPEQHLKQLERSKRWREANSDKVKEYSKKWYEDNFDIKKQWKKDNPSKVKLYHKQWQEANPDKLRNRHLKNNYDITLEQYNQMLELQNGVCGICLQPEKTTKRSLAVDHCHKTGKIRGLLCSSCNTALGLFKDNPECLRKATAYLESSIKDL